MLTVLLHARESRYVLPAGFLLIVVPPVVGASTAWRLLTHLLPSRWQRVGDDFLYSFYSSLTVFFFETLARTEIVLSGDANDVLERKMENVLYMSNHQTTADWMVSNILAARIREQDGALGRIRYVMKNGLKFLPIIGFYLGRWGRGGVFVHRRQEASNGPSSKSDGLRRDLELIRESRLRDAIPTWLVVYPEGTRFEPKKLDKIKKSQTYTEDNQLATLKHLLAPRAKAVEEAIRVLGPSLDAVYHVTVAYSSSLRADRSRISRTRAPNMSEILMGRCPFIHIHLKRIPQGEIPTDLSKEETRKWLHDLYRASDEMLEGFYSVDPGRRGKLLSDGDTVSISSLSFLRTAPTFVFFLFIMAMIFSTGKGRELYWKSWVYGTPVCALFSALSYS